jgi:hypothetical protein
LFKINNLDDFCNVLIAQNGLHNYEKILPFLLKTNRTTQADIYVKNMETLLKNDERLAFFQERFKEIMGDEEITPSVFSAFLTRKGQKNSNFTTITHQQ